MVDKKNDRKEAEELRKIYNHYIDKRSEKIKKTHFKVEGMLGDVIGKDSISEQQITKLNSFLV